MLFGASDPGKSHVPGVVYLGGGDQFPRFWSDTLALTRSASPTEVQDRINSGSAWGIAVDASSLASISQDQLVGWFTRGVVFFGINLTHAQLLNALGPAAFSDIDAQRPLGAPSVTDDLRMNRTPGQPFFTYLTRSAAGFSPVPACSTSQAGYRLMTDRLPIGVATLREQALMRIVGPNLIACG
ncbi:MAG: hypothetical protein R3B97_00175 [Dehalococcoidia bacterium]|nr:hypothetical protein [Dehalococcoidia bacterium]MCB9485364.1 hypothetical protein [Thermoflexaceae bacterium]